MEVECAIGNSNNTIRSFNKVKLKWRMSLVFVDGRNGSQKALEPWKAVPRIINPARGLTDYQRIRHPTASNEALQPPVQLINDIFIGLQETPPLDHLSSTFTFNTYKSPPFHILIFQILLTIPSVNNLSSLPKIGAYSTFHVGEVQHHKSEQGHRSASLLVC